MLLWKMFLWCFFRHTYLYICISSEVLPLPISQCQWCNCHLCNASFWQRFLQMKWICCTSSSVFFIQTDVDNIWPQCWHCFLTRLKWAKCANITILMSATISCWKRFKITRIVKILCSIEISFKRVWGHIFLQKKK